MAESSPERSPRVGIYAQRAPHLLAVLAAAALLAGTLPGGAPPMPVIPAESVHVTGGRRSSRQAIARITTCVRRLARLLLAPREIAAVPTRRTANPVLPTVGRPRDGPASRIRNGGDRNLPQCRPDLKKSGLAPKMLGETPLRRPALVQGVS